MQQLISWPCLALLGCCLISLHFLCDIPIRLPCTEMSFKLKDGLCDIAPSGQTRNMTRDQRSQGVGEELLCPALLLPLCLCPVVLPISFLVLYF